MHRISRWPVLGLLTAAGVLWSAGSATAGPLPAAAYVSPKDTALIEIRGRVWNRAMEYYYYPPNYYLPPPRMSPYRYAYRYAPPPVVVYRPRVYGWYAVPRVSSCGLYRYWNGVRCADARYDPPYLGPRR